MNRFQSTLPHGERPNTCLSSIVRVLFQSTLPHGERLPFVLCSFPNRDYFNPRSRMGSDGAELVRKYRRHYFNPRSRMGSDSSLSNIFWELHYFNPRSRMGSDSCASWARFFSVIFQSTLPHGERRHPLGKLFRQLIISIHAPAWGATRRFNSSHTALSISIHAPAWGATAKT